MDDKYQLYLGDCLNFMRTMEPGSVDAVITDPPYGMNNNSDYSRFTMGPNGHGLASSRNYPKIIGDDKPFDPSPFLNFSKVILFGYNHFAQRLPVGTILVWIKKLDPAFGTFLSDAELAWMKGGKGVFCYRDQTLLGETRYRAHPNQKPLSLMKWCIEKVSNPDDLIFDPFMGSGTTGVACMQLGRRFIGCEIDPGYFAIAEKRIKAAVMQMLLPFDGG